MKKLEKLKKTSFSENTINNKELEAISGGICFISGAGTSDDHYEKSGGWTGPVDSHGGGDCCSIDKLGGAAKLERKTISLG